MANYLLDTYTLLWFFDRSKNLSQRAFQEIVDIENETYVRVASYWEMTIKSTLGKLTLPDRIENMVHNAERANILTLEIKPSHLEVLHGLPLHHRDPFDRLMIAQGKSEGLTVITRDHAFEGYDLKVLW